MLFGITPLRFEISKDPISISLIGIEYKKDGAIHFSSIGLSLSKWEKKDRFIWNLNLHFYNFRRIVTIKTILKNMYCECRHCNELIWNNDSPYCSTHGDLEPEDITILYRDPHPDPDVVKQMREAGYLVLYIHPSGYIFPIDDNKRNVTRDERNN